MKTLTYCKQNPTEYFNFESEEDWWFTTPEVKEHGFGIYSKTLSTGHRRVTAYYHPDKEQ